jgi:DNA polymerase-3 subunit epsilon
MGPNSLDALCRRYGIDNSHRTKHGALLDCELLAEVYIELIGGKQAALGLEVAVTSTVEVSTRRETTIIIGERPAALAPRLSEADLAAHAALVAELGENAVWVEVLR